MTRADKYKADLEEYRNRYCPSAPKPWRLVPGGALRGADKALAVETTESGGCRLSISHNVTGPTYARGESIELSDADVLALIGELRAGWLDEPPGGSE